MFILNVKVLRLCFGLVCFYSGGLRIVIRLNFIVFVVKFVCISGIINVLCKVVVLDLSRLIIFLSVNVVLIMFF